MKNQYCSPNKMNKLKLVPCRDIYISQKYLLINWTSLEREENLTPVCFLFQKEIADSFRATEIFYRSAGKWRETDHHWETIQIGISSTIPAYQLTSSSRSLSLSLSYSLYLFLSLSLSSYPSYSLLTLGHCDDACLRSALKSRNCCWYQDNNNDNNI